MRCYGSVGRWARDASTVWVMVISCIARKAAEGWQLVDGLVLMLQLERLSATEEGGKTEGRCMHLARVDRAATRTGAHNHALRPLLSECGCFLSATPHGNSSTE